MKRIEAVVRRDKLPDVKLALAAVPHRGLTACATAEQDPQSGVMLQYRSSSHVFDMTPRVSVCVLVDDVDASAAVDAIATAARTGRDGDGTIVVIPVEQVVHISETAAVA